MKSVVLIKVCFRRRWWLARSVEKLLDDITVTTKCPTLNSQPTLANTFSKRNWHPVSKFTTYVKGCGISLKPLIHNHPFLFASASSKEGAFICILFWHGQVTQLLFNSLVMSECTWLFHIFAVRSTPSHWMIIHHYSPRCLSSTGWWARPPRWWPLCMSRSCSRLWRHSVTLGSLWWWVWGSPGHLQGTTE